jgi:hypothetical protein
MRRGCSCSGRLRSLELNCGAPVRAVARIGAARSSRRSTSRMGRLHPWSLCWSTGRRCARWMLPRTSIRTSKGFTRNTARCFARAVSSRRRTEVRRLSPQSCCDPELIGSRRDDRGVVGCARGRVRGNLFLAESPGRHGAGLAPCQGSSGLTVELPELRRIDCELGHQLICDRYSGRHPQ